ncbi:MAG: toxic anion resistance protein [Verrucomicrobia bacterium]|nr:toxic anion resistance protein [Verrucomicrobiota bacterium]
MSEQIQQSTQTSSSAQALDMLALSTPEALKSELGLAPVESIPSPEVDPELDAKATAFVDAVLAAESNDPEAQTQQKNMIDNFGLEMQKMAANRSKMLERPIRDLMKRGEDGGEVAKALVELKKEVEELNPNDIDFNASGMAKIFGKLPFIGNKLSNYFQRYASAQEIIDEVIKSLEKGKDQLIRDNKTLTQDQMTMRALTKQLERMIQMGMLLDDKLVYKLDREIPKDDPRHRFISEELLFPLRQRIQDLQQQLVVNQQGVLSIELVIRNNRELIRGVDRAINVTVSALSVAVTVALALNNQKLVLDKITSLNNTTSSLISGTSARLKTQGVQIHKQASSTMLNMNDLKRAFADINAAIDEVSRYRLDALPKMAGQIQELASLTAEGERKISRLEQGSRMAPKVQNLDLNLPE